MSEPVDTPGPGNDGIPQHAAPDVPGLDEPRPEPVLSAARLAGVISGVILSIGGVLKLVGWLIPADYDLEGLADQTGNAILALGAAWSLVGPWVTARIRARDKVTPLVDPRDALGRKLTFTEET